MDKGGEHGGVESSSEQYKRTEMTILEREQVEGEAVVLKVVDRMIVRESDAL
jgi:hypothetical protein